MVVRSEVDACIQDTLNDESNPSSDTMEVSGLSPAGTQMESYGLNVLIGGNFVSQHNLLELKTCVYKKLRFHDWEKVYPQLFLSNTPNVFLAIHDSGHFSELMTEKLGSGSLLRAAEKLNPQVQRLMATLEMIQKFAILHGKESRLSLVHQNGRLTVYLRENKESCLPAEIMSRFETP